jgi:hypothetical protein
LGIVDICLHLLAINETKKIKMTSPKTPPTRPPVRAPLTAERDVGELQS